MRPSATPSALARRRTRSTSTRRRQQDDHHDLNQKGGVGKTTTAANLPVLLARQHRRVLATDSDPQFARTRQLGAEERSLGVNLVDILAGRAAASDAIVPDIHGVDVIAAAAAPAGVEMSLVSEIGRERFLTDALDPVTDDYDDIIVDTPPNLGLLAVNALVVADSQFGGR